jgi:hypothetical protein
MSNSISNLSTLDLARQQLISQSQNGQVTLEQALEASVAGTKIKDLPDVKGALSGLTVNGKISVDTVLTCVNSRYDNAGGNLVPKGTGTPLDAKGMDLSGLSGLAEMMLLLIRNAAEQRKAGQEVRMARSEAIEQKLMDAAADMRNGAIVAMVMGVASGAVTIAGGVAGLRGSVDTAQSYNSIGGGFGTVFSSLGQGAQGILNAEAKEKEAEAEKMRNEREAEGDVIANLKDFMQTTLQLIQTMLDKENETMTRVMV